MRRSNPDFARLIATEYVFGLIRGRARERLEGMRRHDIELDRAIRSCEYRFGSLLLEVPEVAPGPALAGLLRSRLGIPHARPAAHSIRRWQLVSGFSLAAAVLLAAGLFWQSLELQPAPPRLMAVSMIRNASRQTTFVAEVTAHARRVMIYAVASPSVPSNRTLELWALVKGKAPIAVGLIPRQRLHGRFVMPAPARAHLVGLAISLEPLGGSPKPYPTGPIVGKGPMTLLASVGSRGKGPVLLGAS
jgi:anti-sigma-K factor RskA